jgi:hypothetical protein
MHKFLIANTTEHWEVHCYVPVGHYWWRNTEKDYPTSNVILINGNVTIKVIELGLLPVIAIESFPVDEQQTRVVVSAFDGSAFANNLKEQLLQHFPDSMTGQKSNETSTAKAQFATT